MNSKIKPDLHIAMGITSNYAIPAYVTLFTLLTNNKQYNAIIYIISDELDYSQFYMLQTMFSCRIVECHCNKNNFSKVKLEEGHLNHGTLFRLLLDHFIPVNVEYVLYIDADLIINGDLGPLIETEFKTNELAMAVKCNISTKHADDIGISKGDYFNAGVIYFSFKACVERDVFKLARDEIFNRDYKFLDQDVLNIVLESHVHYISHIWNYEYFRVKTDLLNGVKTEINDKVIFHYTGKYKPWEKLDPNPYGKLYREYFKLAFGEEVLLEDNRSVLEFVKFKIFRLVCKVRLLSKIFIKFRSLLRD